MILNNATAAHPAPGSLEPRRRARTIASAATMGLIEKAGHARVGHLSFVLGIMLAVAAATSLGAFDSGASPTRPQGAQSATHAIAVSKIPAAPIYFVLVDSH